MWMVDVLGLKLLLALSAFSNGDCLPWCLARSPYTSSPFYARRRFIFLCCVSDLLVTLRADSQLTGRLGIKLARDWKILGRLIRANTGSGPQTNDPIDLAAVVSVVSQSFLQFPDIGPILDHWRFFVEIGFTSERRAWDEDPCRQQY
jgi:hypothetical protein